MLMTIEWVDLIGDLQSVTLVSIVAYGIQRSSWSTSKGYIRKLKPTVAKLGRSLCFSGGSSTK